MTKHRVVIVGGGFGGLKAAQALKRADVAVTLIDRRNFHLFQPLLYQVATGGLSPGNIAAPLRSILKRQHNCRVVMADVVGFDVEAREVITSDGTVPYDSLIVAAGARTSYFGNDAWAEDAPGLKSIEDALEIRKRVLTAFERAELESDPEAHSALMTFVVVGAGPTGVELAGTMSEIASHTLKAEFRRIAPETARIILVDMVPRVLNMFDESLSRDAEERLRKINVEVRLGAKVTAVDPHSITLEVGGRPEVIRSETILWAAGVAASPLGKKLAAATGAENDRAGRITVGPDVSLAGHPEIFAIGDCSSCAGENGRPLPGVAPVAMQQGEYAARLIQARLRGQTLPPFRYHDYGSMATIGRSAAVAQLGRWKFTGRVAWWLWLFVHLMQIVTFQNRVLVLLQWAWNYATYTRSARLITDVGTADAPKPLPKPKPPVDRETDLHRSERSHPSQSPSLPAGTGQRG